MIQFIYDFVSNMNLDADKIFANSPLNKSVLSSPDNEISDIQEQQLIRNILSITSDPLLGLKFGINFKLEKFGTVGYAVLCAKTRAEALDIYVKNHSLTASYFKISQHYTESELIVELTKNSNIPDDLLFFQADTEVTALALGEGDIVKNRKSLKCIHLMHNQSHLKKEYESCFDCPVIFDSQSNRIIFYREALDIEMPRADIETSELCQIQCNKILSQLENTSSFIEEVRKNILSKAGNFPSIDEIAINLNTSQRTLRRKLTSEGTNYQNILTEVRLQLAKDYLNTSLTIDKISELVGYSEPANFSLAFKRWTSMSPSEYRKSIKVI